jgi:thiamine pyrophosphate-dependent acetolactate synthase large subunit-like protein
MRVADQLAQTLEAAGVERVWGIVGDSLNGFTECGTRRWRRSPPAPRRR